MESPLHLPLKKPVSFSRNWPVHSPINWSVNSPINSPGNWPAKSPVHSSGKSPVSSPFNSPFHSPINSTVKLPINLPIKYCLPYGPQVTGVGGSENATWAAGRPSNLSRNSVLRATAAAQAHLGRKLKQMSTSRTGIGDCQHGVSSRVGRPSTALDTDAVRPTME
jgi:hypothetical protein